MVSWILIFNFVVKALTGFTTLCGVSKHEWLMKKPKLFLKVYDQANYWLESLDKQ